MKQFLTLTLALVLAACGPKAITGSEVNINEQGVAIHGYDTVAYFVSGAPAKGSEEHKVTLNGATWYFANAENKKAFEAEPAKYLPQYGGYCAFGVTQEKKIDVEPDSSWKIVDGKLYLNYTKPTQLIWETNLEENIIEGDRLWQTVKSQ